MQKRGHPERLEQFKIAEYLRDEHPKILFTSSIAGLRLPTHLAANLSQAGYKRGTPDLMIFAARKGYHALFIDVKAQKGKPSDEQLDFQEQARKAGYMYEFSYGREEGIKIVKDYLS